MLKKTITYTDYDGNEITEDFYFHISKAKIAEMETESDGGYSAALKELSEHVDGKKIMQMMKDFILNSYGIKSEDGKHFYQSKELSRDFEATEAYSELYMELCTSAEAAIAFVSGIFPFNDAQRKELAQQVKDLELPSKT